MSNVDKVKIHGQYYYILSPSIVGDYVETIGEGCKNPNGYAQGRVFVGLVNDVMYLFKASRVINYQETITENYNCGRRTLDDIGGNATTPDISMTASVDGTTGTPAVAVTETGTVEFPNFNLAFTGIKGETGQSAYEAAVAGGYPRSQSAFYDELASFSDLASQAQTSATNAANSASNALSYSYDAEAWAVGERNGTSVDVSDECYNNNSKYYSQVSEGYKNNILNAYHEMKAFKTIMALIIGDIYLMSEDGSNLITEAGDKIIIDY